MRRHFLHVLKCATVDEVGGDPGGAEGVTADFRRNTGHRGATADHPKDGSGLGRWGNGGIEVGLSSTDDLPYVMGLVRQSFERQMGLARGWYASVFLCSPPRDPAGAASALAAAAEGVCAAASQERATWSSKVPARLADNGGRHQAAPSQ